MINKILKNKYHILIILLGIIFFIPFLGNIHLFDWDEINFAESSREMLITGDYFKVQINFEPFQEKPPFFFWLQALSMSIFGVNEFAARFPNAIIGIITLLVIFKIGTRLKNKSFGLIWVLIYIASLLPHLYYKSGIIDPVFNLFIFLGIVFLIKTHNCNIKKLRTKSIILSGVFIGFAIITKGPVGLLILLLTFLIYWISIRFKKIISIKEIILFGITAFLITSLWFGYEVIKNGPWFIIEFIQYQLELFSQPVAGHKQPVYYHFIVILLGCFPMSIIAIPRLFRINNSDSIDFEKWMRILFWTVLILFTIVSTKIVHYSSMCYLPLSFLATLELYERREQILNKRLINILVISFGILFSIILTLLPIITFNKETLLLPYLKSQASISALKTEVIWSGTEFLIGLFFALCVAILYYQLKQNKIINALISIVIGAGITLQLYSVFVVPKIEQYSQGAAIEFYESIADKDKYLTTLGFKSYAQYFYGKTKILDSSSALFKEKHRILETMNAKSYNDLNRKEKNNFDSFVVNFLAKGEIDKTTYFVSKINKDNYLRTKEEIKFLYTKGGFTFYKREPK